MSQLCAGDALVVVADGGQAVLDGAVAGDVHDRRAVLQRAELVDGGERRAGVVGLVAERPVELGGVADRLVDGQPQVATGRSPGRSGRPRPTARRASRRAGRAARRARRPSRSRSPVRYSQPRPTGGAIVRIESKTPRRSSVPWTSTLGLQRAPAAGWSWCRRGRRRTCSPRPAAAMAGRVLDTRAAPSSAAVQSREQRDLVGRAAPRAGRSS